MKLYLKLLMALALALGLVGCDKGAPFVPVDFSKILYKGISPSGFFSNNSTAAYSTPALKRTINLSYLVSPGDTLSVLILEFESDVYAMDYYMNSGRFQGITPILRGDYLEQSIRSDSRVFIFHHDSFRRYERSDLEAYVRSFPDYRGGFPQEFLSLPFEYRVAGRSSIQTRYFMGVKAYFPVLVQNYRSADLQWNVARSWDLVDESRFAIWAAQLTEVEPVGVERENDVVYFDAGNGGNGMAKRLAGGRIAVVWGYLSWVDLLKFFNQACDRIYEARF